MCTIVGLDTDTDVSDWNIYLLPLLWWGLSNSIITNQLSSPRNQPLLFSGLFSPPSSNENLSNQLEICFATYYMFSSRVSPKRLWWLSLFLFQDAHYTYTLDTQFVFGKSTFHNLLFGSKLNFFDKLNVYDITVIV